MIRFNTGAGYSKKSNNQAIPLTMVINSKNYDAVKYTGIFYWVNELFIVLLSTNNIHTPQPCTKAVLFLSFQLILYAQAFFMYGIHKLGYKSFGQAFFFTCLYAFFQYLFKTIGL